MFFIRDKEKNSKTQRRIHAERIREMKKKLTSHSLIARAQVILNNQEIQ